MRVVALMLLLTGCITGAPSEPKILPAVVHPLFEPCVPNDGASAVQIFKDGLIQATLEVQWKAKGDGDWALEVTNAAGITMVSLEKAGAKLNFAGKGVQRFPKLSIDSEGFLEVDGDAVGIKASEVPCVLGFRLPRSWMSLVRDVETEGKKMSVEMADGRREIRMTVKDTDKADASCTRITWSNYLLFKQKLNWCRSGASAQKRQAAMTGIENFTFKWVAADDGA